ncbi:aldehyde dehydrogenase family protein [Streptomyces sp. WMMC500]|uniref:aldehyde dehydrogenase family protein n=1 Tax=Streptomyces sp. WMMC500 TaxID=3015154 RepID=UPI00248C0C6F|nr:aldehyde dehydrogenase family protein [Streptomyces sp. WMMC500]WBB61268.1 aldehyde dehydrogenase family protein [Streptomyces sp. WMMC500]
MSQTGRADRLLIDGRLVSASDGGTFDNVNPATEEILGATADATAADLDTAVAAARRAFDTTPWSTDPAFRVRCLRQLQQALVKNADRLKEDLVAEIGTPVVLTGGPQFATPVEGIGWVADLTERYAWETDLGEASGPAGRSQRWIRREPIGVVGAITPWNFPTQINLAKVAPALAAGCTVVLKPAPDSPWAATALGRLAAEETDLPAGVLNVVASSRHEIGHHLASDPRVDMVSFTGSTATGRAVMTAAAGNLTKVFLELGGKSALVALDDADLATAAVTAAFHITTHAGQGCAILSRLLVPRTRYEECLTALVETLRGWPYGDPADPANLMGPLISERQRRRVLGYVERGVAEGARIALGGGIPADPPKGWFVEPTVLADVGENDTVAQEEIFGPVLSVIPYDGGDDEAVRIAGNSAYGLSGGVISASPERAREVARRLRVGTVSVNGGDYYSFDVPFGGYRHSGIGRESGVAGFEEYLQIKSMAEGV